jgi:hypothetical protein
MAESMKSPILYKKIECNSTNRATALDAHRAHTSFAFSTGRNHLMRTVLFAVIIAAPIFVPSSASGQINACDINKDGVVNVVDGQLAVNMSLGITPCTANVVGSGICTTDVVNRVITAALGGACVTVVPPPHSVTLNWVASVSVNINGYNIYRSPTSGGPYTKMNSSLALGTTYTDSNVVAGQTYYYVATAVDINNNESTFSAQAQAVVPTP